MTRPWVIAGAVATALIVVLTWASIGGPLSSVWAPGSGTSRSGEGATPTFLSFFGPSLRVEKHGGFGWSRTVVEPETGPGGSPALRVDYPAHSSSQRSAREGDTTHGGAQAYLTWAPGCCDEAWLAYDVRFPSGFRFVKGGKLPGMFGGSVTSGQHIPDGTNGFSTRYMWRADGVGEVYAYLPTSDTHGSSLGRGNWVWPTGRWTHALQHVRLNSPGSADGLIEVWIDGVAVLRETGLTFRTVPELHIDGLFFSTFFGGSDETWATPVDQTTEFANFTMSRSALPVR